MRSKQNQPVSDGSACFSQEKLDAMKAMPGALLGWYDANARNLPWRASHDAYRVWVSEIMLQQTRVETVIPYFERFLKELPDLPSLASADEDRLLKLWEGLGYYSRVRNMQKAAQAVVRAGKKELPASYEKLLALPGIGPYTAGAVASIAYGIAVPAVDGNVLRVLARLFACGKDIALPPVKRAFEQADAALLSQDRPGDFNQAMMELGATVCLPHTAPRCGACPIRAFCAARKAGEPSSYPYQSPKKPRAVEKRTVFVLISEGKVLLRRRAEKGLLAGLWELPNLSGWLEEEAVRAALAGWGMEKARVRPLAPSRHIFSHIEWRMHGLLVLIEDRPPMENGVWAGTGDLSRRSIPTAFRAYMSELPGLLAASAEGRLK